MRNRDKLFIISMALWMYQPLPVFGQFSPGELSKAHAKFEGISQCTRCHEVGNEIDGTKCLSCHEEISTALNAKKGFHYRVSHQRCVTCHKEHLGKEARTYQFD